MQSKQLRIAMLTPEQARALGERMDELDRIKPLTDERKIMIERVKCCKGKGLHE